jgi:hypothetical protein
LLKHGHGVAEGRLGLGKPAGLIEQDAQVGVACGQLVAVIGSVGELGGQLLADG